MIAICVPSRGLIFSRTVQSVINGMAELSKIGVGSAYFTSHDLPIPDAHNYCVETALQNPAIKKIFFVEEDNFIFPDAFVALATSDYDIATLQYNDKNGSPFGIIHYNEAQEIIWCGLGATCIKREVFEKLGKPYFRTDTRYKITKKHLASGKMVVDYEKIEPHQRWDETKNEFVDKNDPYIYGGLDIDFYHRARNNGFKINALQDFRAHHFKLVKLGEPYTNQGVHEIQQV